ncbi:PREDICTED: zinc finger protein 185 [Buceros rhinoceros silvestris]|uniref:zinc finger protein 185 n=1 Tax=Buceros rhinoceros silvestris TaxID=175836 RepID=UPI0005288487|nr:PREDICTED: zinc finger protein 185 [Buceros rhinoceros silvestris]
MSLGISKGGVIPPTEEDRRRIIRQMKVRTTLKGDKSWIHHHNSDSEDEKSSSPLSPAPKPQPGYLIRGVFTRTIDKTSDSSSSGDAQKSACGLPLSSTQSLLDAGGRGCSFNSPSQQTQQQVVPLPWLSPSDFRAPYNVKQKSADLDEEDTPFTPDEHKKRTEAANSVLRRTASRERAYVLSAAKKSNGSPTQEFPPLFAKRIEIEEEEGQQRRSATAAGPCRLMASDSSTNGLRKPTAGPCWNEPKTTVDSPSSPGTGSKSQPATSLSDASEPISTATDIRNGETRQAPNGESSSKAVSQHGNSDKPLRATPEPFPWDELVPRGSVTSPNGSYPERTEANNGFDPPKSSSGCRDRPADATEQLHRQYEPSHYLEDAKAEPARTSLQPDVPSPPERAPVHLQDIENPLQGSVLGYEERSSSQGRRSTSAEVPADSKPYWTEARFSDSTNQTEKGQEPPDRDVHPEPPRVKDHAELEPSMTWSMLGSEDSAGETMDINKGIPPSVQSEGVTSGRPSSLPGESVITAPETQHVDEPDARRERITPASAEHTGPTTASHQESPGDWRHHERSPVAARSHFRESTASACEPQHAVPLYGDHQPFSASMPAPSHRIPAYADSPLFTRRPAPDYEGRSSPRNSRYDSGGAWGLCEFNPTAGRHNSLPRDTTMAPSPRSHRVPFYMDSLSCNSTRLLSSSSERICGPVSTSPHHSPVASGYQPDPSAAGKGVLFVKEYVNSSELSASPRYGSGSLGDLTDLERATYGHPSYRASAALPRSSEPLCTYCSREIRDCPKIIIEHLNICCHEYCFRCGICHKAMGDLLDKMFIHRDIVHCDKCYEKLF